MERFRFRWHMRRGLSSVAAADDGAGAAVDAESKWRHFIHDPLNWRVDPKKEHRRESSSSGDTLSKSIQRKVREHDEFKNGDVKAVTFASGLKDTPDVGGMLFALKECSRSKDLKRGRELHARAVDKRLVLHQFVANNLISMYAQCGSMVDARKAFDSIICRDIVSWNTLLKGYVDNGESMLAVEIFNDMEDSNEAGCIPDARTYVAVLTAYASLIQKKIGSFGKIVKGSSSLIEKAKALHSDAMRRGCCNVFVENKLLDFYAKCGSMRHARFVFDEMAYRNVVSWNTVLQGYVENEESQMALELFEAMQGEENETREPCHPDVITYAAALMACAALANKQRAETGSNYSTNWVQKGKAIHSVAVMQRCCDIFLESTLVDMYAKCGNMVEARHVFDHMKCRDVVCWNTLLQGYVENGENEQVTELFDSMQVRGSCTLDARTYTAALMACAALGADCVTLGKTMECSKWLEKGRSIHSAALKNRCCDIVLESALIDMYAKCGSMVEARNVFDKMVSRDIVAWTSLLQGYVENGEREVALKLFEDFMEACAPDARAYALALAACGNLGREAPVNKKWLEEGKAIHSQAAIHGCCDISVENAAISMYAKCGSISHAQQVFDNMKERNMMSWSSLIQRYVDCGQMEVALKLVSYMDLDGIGLGAATFTAAIEACINAVSLEKGIALHSEIENNGLEKNAAVGTSLVDFYGRCGMMEAAKQAFDRISSKGIKAWNTLMYGYTLTVDIALVFETFRRMEDQGMVPNEITFSHVLTCCAHAGLITEGRQYFDSMEKKYGVTPDIKHYSCLIALLGRANKLDEALQVVKSMPFEPTAIIWRTLLGACYKWKNVEVGQLAYERLVAVDAEDPTAYVLMRNIYAGVGKLDPKEEAMS